jgi:hypothetical protein
MGRPGTFKKGNKAGIGARGQLRKDLTNELIRQLNEVDPHGRMMRSTIAWRTAGKLG